MPIKQLYRTTFQQRSLGMVEEVGVIDYRMEESLRRTDGMCSVELSPVAVKRIHKEPTGC